MQWLRRGRGIVLAYHNVVPDSGPRTGDLSLHLCVTDFARQLDMLCSIGQVVSLEELLSGAEKEDPQAMSFAVTFDDAYRGAVTLGVRELERRGLPATFFVAPGLLGDRTFWWDALYENTGHGLSKTWSRILTEGDGTFQLASRVAQQGDIEMKSMPEFWRSAGENDLQEAMRVTGITIGSHSWSHPSLVRLSGAALEEEVARSRDWLRRRFGERYLDVLAYPYGLHSASVRNAARDAGYRAGFGLAAGSLHVADVPESRPEAFSLPRLNVPAGVSLPGLRLKAAWC